MKKYYFLCFLVFGSGSEPIIACRNVQIGQPYNKVEQAPFTLAEKSTTLAPPYSITVVRSRHSLTEL